MHRRPTLPGHPLAPPPARPGRPALLLPALLLALLAAAAPLPAQTADSLVAGVRLRVQTRSALTLDGAYVGSDDGGLTLVGRSGVPGTVRWPEVRRVDRHVGRRTRSEAFHRGARPVATVMISLTMAATAIAIYSDARNPCDGCFVNATTMTVAIGTVWTGIGSLAGGLVGLSQRDRWERVRIER